MNNNRIMSFAVATAMMASLLTAFPSVAGATAAEPYSFAPPVGGQVQLAASKDDTPFQLAVKELNGNTALIACSLLVDGTFELNVGKSGTKNTQLVADAKPFYVDLGDEYAVSIKTTIDGIQYNYDGCIAVAVENGKAVIVSSGFIANLVCGEPDTGGAHPQEDASRVLASRYEVEPNNTPGTADRLYDDDDMYGRIYSASTDVDWYVVSFPTAGAANFWLGSIPSGCDYDLALYASNGTTRLGLSQNSGTANELITYSVSANTNYYVKVYSYSGSSSSYYLFRAKNYPAQKGSQTAPAAPTVSSTTTTSITLATVSGCEYSRGGTTWQTSPAFNGLTASTPYSFYQRKAATATLNASPASAARTASTAAKGSQAAPAAPTVSSMTATSITLATVSGCEYSRGGATWQTSPAFTGLTASTSYSFYQRKAATATLNASPSSLVRNATTAAKGSQAAPAAPTVSSSTTTSITLATVSGCEYSRGGATWQTSPAFTGLTASTSYNFYQRKAATDTLNVSPASAARTATTAAKGSQAAPAAPTVSSSTATSITLATVSGCEYSRGGATWQTSPAFTGLTASTSYSFYQRKAATDTLNVSPASAARTALTAAKGSQAAPAAPTVLSSSTTSITLAAVGGYEYSRGGTMWQASPIFTGLTASTMYSFYQRKAETASLNVSPSSPAKQATTSPKGSQAAPAAPTVSSTTATSITLATVSGCEYSRGGTTWQTSPIFTGLTASTTYYFYQRKAETVSLTASMASSAMLATTSKVGEVAVKSPPLPTDVTRGTASQYLEMGIGWPLGGAAVAGKPTHNVEDRSKNYLNSRFGTRTDGLHLGIDVRCNENTPLIAVTSGFVHEINTLSSLGQGYAISIQSNTAVDPVTKKPLIFTYMHMKNPPTFLENDYVLKGERVGFSGNTGASKGPHLHFEASNSGGVWTPEPDKVNATDEEKRRERVTRRVNPRFFYPADAFIGEPLSEPYPSTTIWNERTYWNTATFDIYSQ
ncbi:MAG: M23 family metallopeptidase [Clostridiales bacterium]|nr:M23 family metallopeptidase [Clostridiales bacterium]